ncbi:MAG: histidine--tRNA ligase [Acidimicrobiales bacterium]
MSKKHSRPRARLPRGFVDTTDRLATHRRDMIDTVTAVYRRHGFQTLETPVVEYLDALGKFLPDVDAPDAGVFALRDDDDQWLALRYDLTAPLARYVAEQRNTLTLPFRRYQVGPVFRREKPGPGRFRQFLQCDFDTVGSRSMGVEAEACGILAEVLEAIGIPPGDYQIRINDRRVLNAVLDRAGITGDDPATTQALRSHVLRSVDKLDRVGLDGVRLLLGPGRMDDSGDFTAGVGLDPDQIDQVLAFVAAGAPDHDADGSRTAVIDRLAGLVGDQASGTDGIEGLTTIDSLLTAMGIDAGRAVIDPTVVRGLDYYTGPVFEAALTFETHADGERRSFGSVAGGGRYDDLVQRFTGQETPACGASVGIDRLLAALEALGRTDTDAADGPVVVTVMDRERLAEYQAMVSDLHRHGIAAELYLGSKRNLGDQLKYADRRNAPAAVIAGSDEFGAGTVVVKDLRYGKAVSQDITDRADWLGAADVQQTVARAALGRAVAEVIARPR